MANDFVRDTVSLDETEAHSSAGVEGEVREGIALALSGGGYRAMLFHAGALARLNELGLLSKLRRVSSVSGGAFAGALLGAQWGTWGTPVDGVYPDFVERFVPAIRAFGERNIEVFDAIVGALPFVTGTGMLARSIDQGLLHGKTLADLPAPGEGPEFVICATNLGTGACWRFSRAYAGDYVVGRIADPTWPLALAVAASAAFPPAFAPMELDVGGATFGDWPKWTAVDRASAAPFREKISLSDGGVYDNHGLEPIVKRFSTLLVSDGGMPFSRVDDVATWKLPMRVNAVTDNQSRALRRRDLIERFRRGRDVAPNGPIAQADLRKGMRHGAYWGIDSRPGKFVIPGKIDAMDFDETRRAQMAAVGTWMHHLGTDVSRDLVRWGYVIADLSLRRWYVPTAAKPAGYPAGM